ncbi:MAG: alanine:cation symporter family protein [Clostridia bacterium]|nr:alanine:cation symporter family protein [Clostridia bacterium]
MEFLNKIVGYINDALYSYILIIILVLGGLYFTIRTKAVQFRKIGEQIKSVGEKNDGKGASSFQALMVSTASRVGTGNIIGVSTALCMGGFGSVFWMWVIALIGASSAFVESTLAQIFKKRGPEGSFGGPAYYIEAAFKKRWLSIVFAVLLMLTYGVGFNMLASYNLQSTFLGFDFYDAKSTPWIIGAVIAAMVAYCLIGGGKRIVKVTSLMVPIMGVAYVVVAIVIICINYKTLPGVFKTIFTEAFDFEAIFGGFAGSCVMYGIKRGLFSNEAGVGSAPNASAAANVKHPAKQGLVQVLSVFIDTIVICSATAFMCMCSGVEPSEALSGAPYVQESLKATLGEFGPIFIAVAMVLFAFTTLLGNLFYVDKCWNYLFKREPSKKFLLVYRIVASALIFVGAGLSAGLLWNVADVLMGLMTIINVPVIVILGKYAFRALKDYERQRKAGKDPTFKAENIDLPYKTDYWN